MACGTQSRGGAAEKRADGDGGRQLPMRSDVIQLRSKGREI